MSRVTGCTRRKNPGFNPGITVRALAACGLIGSATLLAACGGGGDSNNDNTSSTASDPLKFTAQNGVASTVSVYGRTVKYKTYTVQYVTKPTQPSFQTMAIYIPDNATSSSPILMPLKTGAYREIDILTPADVTTDNVNTPSTGTAGTGASHAAALALSKGMVVVSPAARGRNNTIVANSVTTEVGNGPTAITDLKAAVRYLKHNSGNFPGDVNKIVVTGTSGGGAMTSMLGATGDSPAYKDALAAEGAADASDSIFAASPFCPITNLDNDDILYEYYFFGSGITSVYQSGPTGPLPALTLTANDQKLSLELAKFMPAYVNGLGMKNPSTGAPLTLNDYSADATMGGTYRDYLYSVLSTAATKYFNDNGFVASDGSLNAAGQAYMNTAATVNGVKSGLSPANFLIWNQTARTATISNWANYMNYMNRLKPVGAFDNGFYNVTGEMDLFNLDPAATANDITNPNGWNHFDPNLPNGIKNAGLTGATGYTSVKNFQIPDQVSHWAAQMNPMYYIAKSNASTITANPYAASMYGSSTVAKHWRIRVGSYDRDGSPFISLNLATVLANKGLDVDYKIFWEQPHTGSYDNTDMIDWIQTITQ